MPPNNEIIDIRAKYWGENIVERYGADIEDASFIPRTLLLENHGNMIIDSQYSISIKYPNVSDLFHTSILEGRINPHSQGTLDINGLPPLHEADRVEIILSRRGGEEILRTRIQWEPHERITP